MQPIVNHIIYSPNNAKIHKLGFAHPADKQDWNMRQIVHLDLESMNVFAPQHFQSIFKFDIEQAPVHIKSIQSAEWASISESLKHLPISIWAEIIAHLQSIAPDDDVSLLNTLRLGIRYPDKDYFEVDCDNHKTGIKGLGFYPVGRGLFDDTDRRIKGKSIMVLGQDFGGHEGYITSFNAGAESENGPTWRNLLYLLRDAELDEKQVFYTNAVMGQRREHLIATKNSAWLKHQSFVVDNFRFLQFQILVQRPKVVLVLGKESFPILKRLHTSLSKLKTSMTFSQLDASEFLAEINKPLSLEGFIGYTFKLVFLVHPSYRHANVTNRTFAGKFGHEAEVALIKYSIN